MTEYDYSPEALDRFRASQARISRWVDTTSHYPPSNPFLPPTPAAPYAAPLPNDKGYIYEDLKGRARPVAPMRRTTMPPQVYVQQPPPQQQQLRYHKRSHSYSSYVPQPQMQLPQQHYYTQQQPQQQNLFEPRTRRTSHSQQSTSKEDSSYSHGRRRAYSNAPPPPPQMPRRSQTMPVSVSSFHKFLFACIVNADLLQAPAYPAGGGAYGGGYVLVSPQREKPPPLLKRVLTGCVAISLGFWFIFSLLTTPFTDSHLTAARKPPLRPRLRI